MTDLLKLIDYTIWANRKLTTQIRSMPVDLYYQETSGSFPSLRLTMTHLLHADFIMLHRWKALPRVEPPAEWVTYDIVSMTTTWHPLQEEIRTLIGELSAKGDPEVKFVTKAGTLYLLSLSDTVVQSVNHGTFHRGQAVNMIRGFGEKPVATDYFIYCNEHRNQA